MDAIDRKIIRELQRDASLSHAALAERVGASAASVWRRIRGLEQAGVLGATVRLASPEALGRAVNVLCQVRMTRQSVEARADFEQSLAITFWGAYNTVEAVLPGMRARGEGRIVNISSIGGQVSVPHLLPYCVAKFALAGYSHGLRAELDAQGIVVTTVFPGLMRTGSPRNALFKGQHRQEYAWFILGDSLPGVSISAERAARKLVDGVRYGEAEVIVSLPAKLAATFHGVFPGLTADLPLVAGLTTFTASTSAGLLGVPADSVTGATTGAVTGATTGATTGVTTGVTTAGVTTTEVVGQPVCAAQGLRHHTVDHPEPQEFGRGQL